MTTESQDIASEAHRRSQAVPAPRAEALERELWVAVSGATQERRKDLEMLTLAVGLLLDQGARDIRPDEEEVVRQRMKEILK